MADVSRIYVVQDAVKENARLGEARYPVVAIRQGDHVMYANELLIDGPCRLVYSLDGWANQTRVWIETESAITPVGMLEVHRMRADEAAV